MKYKVGDKVKVFDNLDGHEFKIGEVVTITKLFKDYYQAENSEDNWLVDDDEVIGLEVENE